MPKTAENQTKHQGGAARRLARESRDDIDKLPLPPEAKSYARGKGMAFLKAKPQNYIDMVAAVTNQKDRKKGFGNQDAGETTSGKRLKEAVRIVNALIYA